jgi:hypothetical protein
MHERYSGDIADAQHVQLWRFALRLSPNQFRDLYSDWLLQALPYLTDSHLPATLQ